MSSTDDEENMYESQGNLFEENTDYDTLKISDHCTKNCFYKKVFRRKRLRIRSHLLKKSLMENFSFCAVDLSGNLHPYCYKENISPSNVEII